MLSKDNMWASGYEMELHRAWHQRGTQKYIFVLINILKKNINQIGNAQTLLPTQISFQRQGSCVLRIRAENHDPGQSRHCIDEETGSKRGVCSPHVTLHMSSETATEATRPVVQPRGSSHYPNLPFPSSLMPKKAPWPWEEGLLWVGAGPGGQEGWEL